MTAGPWRPVYRKNYTIAIVDLDARALVTQGRNASLSVNVELEGSLDKHHSSKIELFDPNGKSVFVHTGPSEGNQIVHLPAQNIADAKLWWPVGYGEQNLYTVTVTIYGEVSISCVLGTSFQS